jgi:hypothetical protein
MSVEKLIRLTVQVDVEPESANLAETLDYLKGLKGAERVDLVDIEVIKDPRAEEKRQRRALDQSFGDETPGVGMSEAATARADVMQTDEPEDPEPEQDPIRLLDRIKIIR